MSKQFSSNWNNFSGIAYTFDVEANFDVTYHRNWFTQYWLISVPIGIAYVIAIHYCTKFMANRTPFNLRKTLMVWSILLCLLSVYGSIRVLPELVDTFNHRGLEAVVCDREFAKDVRIAFVMFLFVWSKAFELIDTFFIVARKQKLTFLHWYHHFATLIYGFYSYSTMSSFSRTQVAMNYSIHALMYSYYACKAARIYVTRPIAVFITISQISQMVVGVLIALYALAINASGGNCTVGKAQVVSSLIIYSSFLVLFANFFVRTYMVEMCSRRCKDDKRLKTS